MDNKNIYVIKLGSNVLLDDNGIDKKVISNVVTGVNYLKRKGDYVIIVSSGAVASGKIKLGTSNIKGLTEIESGQVFSSLGQVSLMNIYQNFFDFYGINVSQALLTRKDFSDRDRYNSMKKVLLKSLDLGVVPIINENDVLSQEELDFSDNDELSALIAAMIGADKLLILSNIDGLYDNFPGGNLIKEVDKIDESIFSMVGVTKSTMGKGGMESKLKTARLVIDLGIEMYLANGKIEGIIEKISEGKNPGTLFKSDSKKQIDSIRKWLKTGAIPKGKIQVSTIIADLLRSGKRSSLLEIGVEKIEKHFEKKDVIEICDEYGFCLGYGIAKIGSSEIDKKSLTSKIVVHTDYFMGI